MQRNGGLDDEQRRRIREVAEIFQAAEAQEPEAGTDIDRLPRIGSTCDGFRISREIGRGGMGVVYEAEEVETGRRVALKVLSPELRFSQGAEERFRREARTAASLAHENCVFVYGIQQIGGLLAISMELLEGGTLQEQIASGSPIPIDAAVRWTLEILQGLEEAHRAGIVHRDVKPSNCFLTTDGHVKIGDFGLSRLTDPQIKLTRTGKFVGSPLYAAPEQVLGQEVDQRADIYSAGATLYALLTGKPPHTGEEMGEVLARILSGSPEPPKRVRPEIPRELERVVMRMLAKAPARRFRDSSAARKALASFNTQAFAAPVGKRLAAYAVDWMLLWLASSIVLQAIPIRLPLPLRGYEVKAGLELLYFGLTEGWIGASLGKALFGLRVGLSAGRSIAVPPGALRALVYVTALYGPGALALFAGWADATQMEGFWAIGWLLLAVSMRPHNGFRGVHEFASRTRLFISRPEDRTARIELVRSVQGPAPSPAPLLPSSLGPYEVDGLLFESENATLLAARDPQLKRPIWICFSKNDQHAVAEGRRTLRRNTRLRWLQAGDYRGNHWDAFEAPRGAPLHAVVLGRELGWVDARWYLWSLCRELRDASADGTLPSRLSTEMIWLTSQGTLQLLDFGPKTSQCSFGADPPSLGQFLRKVAEVLMLPIAEQQSGSTPPKLWSLPLPEAVKTFFTDLVCRLQKKPSLDDVVARMEEFVRRPGSVARRFRAAQVALATGVLFGAVLSQPWWPRDPLRAALMIVPGGMAVHGPELYLSAAYVLANEGIEGLRAAGAIGLPDRLGQPGKSVFGGTTQVSEERAAELLNQLPSWAWSPSAEDVDEARRTLEDKRAFMLLQSFAATLITITSSLGLLTTLSALVFRGGLLLRVSGLHVHGPNGTRANRVRCIWRTAITWLPGALLGYLAYFLIKFPTALSVCFGAEPHAFRERARLIAMILIAAVLVWLVAIALLAIRAPARTIQERLSRTRLVPA